MLKAQTCPQEIWLLQRQNEKTAFEFKNRKSEALRRVFREHKLLYNSKKLLGARVLLYHLILLRIWN